jgi:dTDP-4-amino-4,6-dideoxygalactose transaminase
MKNKTNKPKDADRTRRTFIRSSSAAAGGLILAPSIISLNGSANRDKEKLALSGGAKAVTASHEDMTTWPRFGAEEEREVIDILRNPPGYQRIDILEESWKNHFDLPFCKAHFNGTSAILAMFFALDLPAGSEVLVPSCTFWATVTTMRFVDLVPILVDIDPVTLNFDVEDARKKLTKNTKAVFPVHISGMPADLDRISEFCNEKGLILLEDACHAHGAKMQGKNIGSWGRMAVYSFQAGKPLPSIEGGMGNYQNQEDFERATTLGHYQWPRKFGAQSKYRNYNLGLGLKLRMHPMAAALAKCQLDKLDNYNALIKRQVRQINDRITKLPGLYEQQNRSDVDRVYYASNRLYLNEKEAGMSRDAVVEALKAEGVEINARAAQYLGNDPIFHESQWWHHMPVIADKYPGVEEASRGGMALPLFTKEAPELVEQYIAAFEKVWDNRKELAKI